LTLLENRVERIEDRLDAIESRAVKKDIGIFGMLGTILLLIIFV